MSSLLGQTASVWKGADGSLAHVVNDGSPVDATVRWKEVDKLQDPVQKLGTVLIDQEGRWVRLPFGELAWLLPDMTGVLVIFRSGSYMLPDGSDVFPAPNNAAIYNADGSLRYQVHFGGRPSWSSNYIIERPFTRTIAYKELPIGRRGEPIEPPIVQFGVLVGTKDRPPESFFVLNAETGELTDGLYTVPY